LKNETQIGNKEIRKQEKKTKENPRSGVVVSWKVRCLMIVLVLSSAHLIHLDMFQHVHHVVQKRHSLSDCYS
jgi:hypothetical protein